MKKDTLQIVLRDQTQSTDEVVGDHGADLAIDGDINTFIKTANDATGTLLDEWKADFDGGSFTISTVFITNKPTSETALDGEWLANA